MSGMPNARAGLVVPMLAMALLAGCSSGGSGSDDEPILPEDSRSGSPGEESSPGTAADEAALEQLFLDYWAAVVELENAEEIDTAVFDGIAESDVAEEQITRVEEFKQYGIIARGEPEIGNVTAEVDGDEGRIEGCVDSENWKLYDQDGEEVPVEAAETNARVVLAQKKADGWIISGHPSGNVEVTISC